ncbi:hypothetical protein ACFVWR_09800 [Leifsonia sp. NPDC058292]|uniref:hypothetical protein n=1 Tax=Leifsonia sp. NPDC058292 TaxID=3346428 RepID=UPI0036D85D80
MSGTVAQKRPAVEWMGRPATRPIEDERPHHLEVVPTRTQRRARPRAAYAIVAISVLLGIVIAQLLLSISVSQGAYQLSSLQAKQTQLQRSYQAASEDLNRLTSPQNLAANANALGMVSNSNPAYLRLSDGAVLGAALPADGSAGTVTGGQGNLVPNSLLAGVPLVTAPKAATTGTATKPPATNKPASDAQTGNSASTGAADGVTPKSSVPLDGALPTPVTH